MGKKSYLLTNQQLQDLNPLVAGWEACAPGHSFGPHIRNYVLLHYVLKGSGTLYAPDGTYPVRAGQIFLILPRQANTYTADLDDPWEYRWVGFSGTLSRRFYSLPRVFDVPKVLIADMLPVDGYGRPEYQIAAFLFRLYGYLFPERKRDISHVEKVKNLIHSAYMQPMQVSTIAREMNLDRRYLTRIFREQTGRSIQQYLIDIRLEAADRYLSQGYNVGQAAILCGYEDVANFSRLYKKHRGCSPGKANQRR